ncbi:MAG TPA: hypothetical protein VEW68_04580 [Patescibacteria group bacterium]|nr:hypothetical protein [Patescibacteria group bacterium]
MTIPPPPPAYESMPEPSQVVTTAGWSVVSQETQPPEISAPSAKPSKGRKSDNGPNLTESWLLATAQPDDEMGENEPKPSMSRALAQYAILVVGLVMVLIGVIVMVVNSH